MSDADLHRQHVMRLCRAVMPGVEGVVLATETGGVLGHEDRVADAAKLALAAVEQRRSALHVDQTAGASALVRSDAGLYLVVFVPPPLAEEWRIPALPGQQALPVAA